jgi:ADP-ribose pyrophosphatase YjhB (NUDIX family)
MPAVPRDGMCLSAFVVVRPKGEPSRVLLGRLNPEAPWDHLGALDPGRLEAWKDRWMLPASHLIVLESPDAAATRIVRELTGLSRRPLEGPIVSSEVYASARRPDARDHWDLEFVYRAEASESEVGTHPAWTELRFVETDRLRAEEYARRHDDIIAIARRASPAGGPTGLRP